MAVTQGFLTPVFGQGAVITSSYALPDFFLRAGSAWRALG